MIVIWGLDLNVLRRQRAHFTDIIYCQLQATQIVSHAIDAQMIRRSMPGIRHVFVSASANSTFTAGVELFRLVTPDTVRNTDENRTSVCRFVPVIDATVATLVIRICFEISASGVRLRSIH